ncbi:Tetratricopeptide-like helical [Akanthomyces lecanii RCEF 1005]|uniref:Tetratricopeptide-like helical n=1 Tax=Akanthomyces lecanii RCEF 1005 TaxID=1081108 RepID=A0A167T2L7_CORDF|nr:Tetratricopeptide-like helical [Akanthomyces lecanii RCEF 1005]
MDESNYQPANGRGRQELERLLESFILEMPDVKLVAVQQKADLYMDNGQHTEARQLLEETVNLSRQRGMTITAACLQPLLDLWVQALQTDGRHALARQIVDEILESFKQTGNKADEPWLAPCIEHMIIHYISSGQTELAWLLVERTFDSYELENLAWKTQFGLLDFFVNLYREHPSASKTASPLTFAPSQPILRLLYEKESLPTSYRALLSHSLRDSSRDHLLTKLGNGSISLNIHSDILIFWSKYFEARLSGRWNQEAIRIEDGLSIESITRIFTGFFYSGLYTETDCEKQKQDFAVADFYGITKLRTSLNIEWK